MATDVDYFLDVTKTWTQNELQTEPCIVHMRYNSIKKLYLELHNVAVYECVHVRE